MFGDAIKERPTPSAQITDAAIEQLLLEAQNMILAGNMDESVDHVLPVFKSRPDDTATNAFVGAVLLSVQQFALAEQFLTSAVNTSRWTDTASVANLAQLFLMTNETPLAIKTLRKGLESNNNVDEKGALSLCFGDVAFSQGNYAEAADWYLSAALKRPSNIDIWVKASTVRYPSQGRNLKFAENVLLQALAANRGSAELLFDMGLAMHGSGRLAEAATFYQEAARMDPANTEIPPALATALHADGQLAEAAEWYATAERQYQQTSNSASAASSSSSSGSSSGGDALAGTPSRAVFLSNHAMLLNALGRRQEGAQLAMRALSIDPTCPDALRAARECTATTATSA